jgi:phospholipid transport system substrate-binding protein
MKRFRQGVFAMFAAATIAVAGFLPHAALANEAPDALIKRVSTDMIEKIKSDKSMQDGDVEKLSAAVESTVMPHVNFQRMTALSVGRNWRSASPEQQQRLMAEYRKLLIRTYAGAMSAVRDQTVKMKPLRGDTASNEVIVRSEVVQPRGEPIQLDYRMEKAGDAWKIYDVNVLGVWLVETYRNQFQQEVASGGIDGLIKSLAEKNKSFEPARKS